VLRLALLLQLLRVLQRRVEARLPVVVERLVDVFLRQRQRTEAVRGEGGDVFRSAVGEVLKELKLKFSVSLRC